MSKNRDGVIKRDVSKKLCFFTRKGSVSFQEKGVCCFSRREWHFVRERRSFLILKGVFLKGWYFMKKNWCFFQKAFFFKVGVLLKVVYFQWGAILPKIITDLTRCRLFFFE